MREGIKGYWFMTWIGLLANVSALPIIALVAFTGPPLQAANISIAISLAWPAAIVGIVGSAGLLAERRWGVILTIVALSMTLSVSFPYGIVRFVLLDETNGLTLLCLMVALCNLLALIYRSRPSHRRRVRL